MRNRALAALGAVLTAALAFPQARETLLVVFKAQLDMEKRLVANDLATLERLQGQLRGATDRLLRLNDDLIRAEHDNEDFQSFQARNSDIVKAETELDELVRSTQQLRATMAARRGTIDQLEAEVRKLKEQGGGEEDALSGTWDVAIEPGGMKGTFELRLDGTLLTGVYELSGGWKGSLRGTFIGDNVRLERIDSQLGLVAVYTARLVSRDDERRLEGRWESTNLASGMAQSGTWLATREKEK